jgi:Flp pilus assembly protein TadD
MSEAVAILQKGVETMPYDAEYYRLLGKAYLSLGKRGDAAEILKKGAQIFPQDGEIRELLRGTGDSARSH